MAKIKLSNMGDYGGGGYSKRFFCYFTSSFTVVNTTMRGLKVYEYKQITG